MAELTPETWIEIRAEREVGASFYDLSKRYGVSHTAISKRARRDGWSDGSDMAQVIRRKVSEKVSEKVSGVSVSGVSDSGVSVSELLTKKKAEAVEKAASAGAEVIERHQREISLSRERLYKGVEQHRNAKTKEEKALAFEDLKAAKITSEALINIHKLERTAWGLEDSKPQQTITIERIE